MAKINVLDKSVAELIAAGEVIERPSAVIKELVENSIDSGASAITVEIKDGGRTFMRVSDNGCGIEEGDIKTAFLRHATSKIKEKADLNSIFTLGFRGEALASICAVSRVQLITRTADQEFGISYEIEGGEEKAFEQAGCALGTTIIVRDLFYNVPARLKFLKKDNTESNVVVSIIEKIAISHPEISFKLIKDGKQVINTPGDNQLKSACFAVFGSSFSATLLPVEYELGGVKVTGFVSKPTASRKNRQMQLFFLNGRYVQTKTGYAAVEQAYKNRIMTGTHPACVLNIQVDPQFVDVNVHPSKIEVRFSDEHSIFSAIYYAVMSALQSDVSRVEFRSDITKLVENEAPEQLKINIPQKSIEEKKQDFFVKTSSSEFKKEFSEVKPQKQTPKFNYKPDFDNLDDENTVLKVSEPRSFEYNSKSSENIKQQPIEKPQTTAHTPQTPMQQETPQKEHVSFKYVGEVFGTYILVETDEKMVIIDKHAAHERIIFEKLRENAEHNPQMLLIPVQVQLSAKEYDAIVSNIENINRLGFEIEDYGMRTVLIRSIPMELDSESVQGLILEIAGKLTEKFTDFSPEFMDWLYHSVACRAAIKAGNKTGATELSALADIVLNDERIRYCPHGRPVAAEMTLYEFKKRFQRIV